MCCKQTQQLHTYVVRCIWIMIMISQGAQNVAESPGLFVLDFPSAL